MAVRGGGAGAPRAPAAAEAAWLADACWRLPAGCAGPARAYISRCVLAEDGAAAAAAAGALLRGALAAAPSLQALLLLADGGAPRPPSSLLQLLPRPAAAAPPLRTALHAAPRAALLPPLVVRRARASDHDELLALLQRAGLRAPALAALPDSCRPHEPFALARLLAGQDESNAVLVAAARGDGDQLVGRPPAVARQPLPFCALAARQLTSTLLNARQARTHRLPPSPPPRQPQAGMLAATCDADVPLLLSAFDLAHCDGFLAPDLYERLDAAAAAQAGAGLLSLDDGGAAESEAAAARCRAALAELAAAALAGRGGAGGPAAAASHGLLAVTMLACEAGDEARAADLLSAAFNEFPGKARGGGPHPPAYKPVRPGWPPHASPTPAVLGDAS